MTQSDLSFSTLGSVASKAVKRWCVLTREPTEPLDQCLEVVRADEARWVVEEFHMALKPGCTLESHQFIPASAWRTCWPSAASWTGACWLCVMRLVSPLPSGLYAALRRPTPLAVRAASQVPHQPGRFPGPERTGLPGKLHRPHRRWRARLAYLLVWLATTPPSRPGRPHRARHHLYPL